MPHHPIEETYQQILDAVTRGATTFESIATQLDLKPRTVEEYIRRKLRQLGSHHYIRDYDILDVLETRPENYTDLTQRVNQIYVDEGMFVAVDYREQEASIRSALTQGAHTDEEIATLTSLSKYMVGHYRRLLGINQGRKRDSIDQKVASGLPYTLSDLVKDSGITSVVGVRDYLLRKGLHSQYKSNKRTKKQLRKELLTDLVMLVKSL